MASDNTSEAAEIPKVVKKPSQMRAWYWATKSKLRAMPAAPSESHTTVTTAAQTTR